MIPYINTSKEVIELNGETFIPGQWLHLADDFDVSKEPDIKKAEVVLQERTQEVLQENGLIDFAKGLEEAAALYSEPIKDVAVDILKYDVSVDRETFEVIR